METRQLVVLAGGLGTRLRAALAGLPKPLADIGGKPLLERQIEAAARYGFRDVLLLTSHGADQIAARLGDGAGLGVRLSYCVDATPLGTAGAVLAARDLLGERFAVCYGDVLFDIDLGRMWDWHRRRGAEATLLVHPNDHPQDSDLIACDDAGCITGIHGYPHPPDLLVRNRVSAAFYIIEKESLRAYDAPPRRDFCKDLFPEMLARGHLLCAYQSREYLKDMGTPERLEKVRADFLSGRVSARNFRRPLPAVFLDRDGTLNAERGWIDHPARIELLPGVAAAIRSLNHAGILAVVATNQPVIARGECTFEGLEKIHARLEHLLGHEGAYVDGIYFCPHHPDAGYPGERTELKVACACRKPAPGLLLRAAEDLHLDLRQSWMIGDSWRDVGAAAAAGIPSILLAESVPANCRPSHLAGSLPEAVDIVLRAENLKAES